MDFSTLEWREFKQLGEGFKKLVTGNGSNLKLCYYKSHSRRAGLTIFNEYIAYKLGVLLNYPIPQVEFLKIGNEMGIISHNIPESIPWQAFSKENVLDLLSDQTVFAKVAAFDFWIKSTDRHDRNLIAQNITENKYEIFMIDHEHSLCDPNIDNNFDDFNNIIKIDGFKTYIPNVELLLTEIEKIEQLPNDVIINLIDSLRDNSDALYTDEHARIAKDLLLHRKGILKSKAVEWYNN